MLELFVIVSTLILSVPLSAVYKHLTSHQKHLYSIIVNIFITWICYGYISVIHTLALSLGVFVFIKMYNCNTLCKVGLVWIWCMSYLSFVHVYTMLMAWLEWRIDYTGIMMMLVIKLTTFSWNCYDKHHKDCKYHKDLKDLSGMKDCQHLKHDDSPNNLKTPSIIEWLGWVYFIPGYMTGPVITFEDYLDFSSIPPVSSDFTLSSALQCLDIRAGVCALIYIVGLRWLPIQFITSVTFGSYSLIYKWLYLCIACFCVRCRYYFAWILAELAFKESGVPGKNIDIEQVELSTNIRDVFSNWNISTNNWLRNCVYVRLDKLGYNNLVCVFCTNVVSALWHGFYPGYYITFIIGGIGTFIHRLMRKHVNPLVKSTTSWVCYSILSCITTSLIVNTLGLPFVLYTIEDTLLAWNNIYYVGLVLLALQGCVVFLVITFTK